MEFYDSTILAPRFGQTTATIPLVVNAIGTSEPTLFSRVYFMGGPTAIFALRNDVRMSGYFPTETPRFRPFSDEETRVAALNSSIHALLCTFDRQSDAAIITELVELRVHDSNFKKVGMNPSRGQPIIQFGQPSTLGPQSGSLVADNAYSAVNATAFLSATGRSDGTIVVRNAPLPLQVGERAIPLLLPLDPRYDDTWRF